MYLPDVNLWLALSFEAHVHHPRALRWFHRAAPDSCAFCRQSQSGFLRLATNPAVFGSETVSLPRAWSLYDELLSDERVQYAPEPPGLEAVWRRYTERHPWSHRVWSDAYLAAFAAAAGLTLVSFDRGLGKFNEVEVVLPE